MRAARKKWSPIPIQPRPSGPDLQPASQREAEAAKELLLTRLMGVHPEVYGGARIFSVATNDGLNWMIEIELSKRTPAHVKLPTVFMGVGVVYKPTGFTSNLMPYQEQS
jgi:hypothetical protein